ERGREDIARFVRGFQPQHVVRWSHAGSLEDKSKARNWPAEAAQRQAMVEDAVFRIWRSALQGEGQAATISSEGDLIVRWKRAGVPATGIIIADAHEEAWTGALALSAGRCEPITWFSGGQGVNATMTLGNFEALETAIEKACDETGLTWRDRGD